MILKGGGTVPGKKQSCKEQNQDCPDWIVVVICSSGLLEDRDLLVHWFLQNVHSWW